MTTYRKEKKSSTVGMWTFTTNSKEATASMKSVLEKAQLRTKELKASHNRKAVST